MTADSSPEPVRTRRLGLLAIGTCVAISAILIFLLTSGGDGSDPSGDVRTIEGSQPEEAASRPAPAFLADIVRASVGRIGSELMFAATMAETIPTELQQSSLEVRFDVSEDGRDTWVVIGTVNVAPVASVASQLSAYGSSTIDGTMPGSIAISGETITIVVDASEIEAWPGDFDWSLSSSLTAFRQTPGSTRFEDRYADDGVVAGS